MVNLHVEFATYPNPVFKQEVVDIVDRAIKRVLYGYKAVVCTFGLDVIKNLVESVAAQLIVASSEVLFTSHIVVRAGLALD